MNKDKLKILKEIILKEKFDEALNSSLKVKCAFESAYNNAVLENTYNAEKKKIKK